MVGGESHKVGAVPSSAERYRDLKAWARDRFDVESQSSIAGRRRTTSRHDMLPFVGQLWPFSAQRADRDRDAQVGARDGDHGGRDARATASWGGRTASRTSFDAQAAAPASPPRPRSPRRTPNVGYHFVRDRLQRGSAEALAPGEGAVVGDGLQPASRLSRRRRQASRALGALHAPRLHRPLQRRGAKLGLPLPRLPLRRGRRGARGARREAAPASRLAPGPDPSPRLAPGARRLSGRRDT